MCSTVPTLGEEEEEEEEEGGDGAAAWVVRMKRLQEEKDRAGKRVGQSLSLPPHCHLAVHACNALCIICLG